MEFRRAESLAVTFNIQTSSSSSQSPSLSAAYRSSLLFTKCFLDVAAVATANVPPRSKVDEVEGHVEARKCSASLLPSESTDHMTISVSATDSLASSQLESAITPLVSCDSPHFGDLSKQPPPAPISLTTTKKQRQSAHRSLVWKTNCVFSDAAEDGKDMVVSLTFTPFVRHTVSLHLNVPSHVANALSETKSDMFIPLETEAGSAELDDWDSHNEKSKTNLLQACFLSTHLSRRTQLRAPMPVIDLECVLMVPGLPRGIITHVASAFPERLMTSSPLAHPHNGSDAAHGAASLHLRRFLDVIASSMSCADESSMLYESYKTAMLLEEPQLWYLLQYPDGFPSLFLHWALERVREERGSSFMQESVDDEASQQDLHRELMARVSWCSLVPDVLVKRLVGDRLLSPTWCRSDALIHEAYSNSKSALEQLISGVASGTTIMTGMAIREWSQEVSMEPTSLADKLLCNLPPLKDPFALKKNSHDVPKTIQSATTTSKTNQEMPSSSVDDGNRRDANRGTSQIACDCDGTTHGDDDLALHSSNQPVVSRSVAADDFRIVGGQQRQQPQEQHQSSSPPKNELQPSDCLISHTEVVPCAPASVLAEKAAVKKRQTQKKPTALKNNHDHEIGRLSTSLMNPTLSTAKRDTDVTAMCVSEASVISKEENANPQLSERRSLVCESMIDEAASSSETPSTSNKTKRQTKPRSLECGSVKPKRGLTKKACPQEQDQPSVLNDSAALPTVPTTTDDVLASTLKTEYQQNDSLLLDGKEVGIPPKKKPRVERKPKLKEHHQQQQHPPQPPAIDDDKQSVAEHTCG